MATDTHPVDFPLPSCLEADLAEKLGVDRAILIEARLALLAPEDFERKKSGIAYFQAGIEKVCTHLHLQIPAELIVTEKKNGPEVLTLTVIRVARHNTHILFATEKKNGPEIAVRVRNTALFVPGQEIHTTRQSGLAHLHGPQPRRRGHSR